MKKTIYFSFLIAFYFSEAMASTEASGHLPSFWDLKYKIINFIIFAAILSKVIKPSREKFNKKSEEVKFLVDSAAKNYLVAEENLKNMEDKAKNAESEISKITSEYQSEVVLFEKNQSEETRLYIARIKRELESKLESEKAKFVEGLSNELINKVVADTKGIIKNNKTFQNQATKNIVSELR